MHRQQAGKEAKCQKKAEYWHDINGNSQRMERSNSSVAIAKITAIAKSQKVKKSKINQHQRTSLQSMAQQHMKSVMNRLGSILRKYDTASSPDTRPRLGGRRAVRAYTRKPII